MGTYTVGIIGTGGSLTRGTTITVQIPGSAGPCLIATATYGSELSDEVQFLRNFRDNSILKTNTGSNFMTAFNAWYYSFSPTVAHLINEYPPLRTAAKFALYPLMVILRTGAATFSLFPTNLEAGAILSGFAVSSLIGVVYVAFPLAGLLAYSSKARNTRRKLQTPAIAVLLGALVSVTLATLVDAPGIVMMISTSTFVLAGVAASSLVVSDAIWHVAQGLHHKFLS